MQIWESKLLQSRAVDGMPAEGQPATRQQYVYPHMPPQQPTMQRDSHKGWLLLVIIQHFFVSFS